MRHYRITKELRNGINKFLGMNYLKPSEIGNELYRLKNYEEVMKVEPKKVEVLLAALFPEEVKNQTFFYLHKDEIIDLAHRLHIEEEKCMPPFHWTQFMIRKETFPSWTEGFSDEDIFRGNIVRFR